MRPCGTWMTPAATISSVISRWMGRPSNRISPVRTRVMPQMLRTSVVLPAPLGPSSPTTPPPGTASDTLRSTSMRPYPAVRPRISSMTGPPSEIGFDDECVFLHFGRASLRYLFTVVENVNDLREVHDDPHVVLDDQEGHARLASDPAACRDHLLRLDIVHA